MKLLTMKKVILLTIFLLLLTTYVKYSENKKIKELALVAKPLLKYCHDKGECILHPNGWEDSGNGGYSGGNLIVYKVDKDRQGFQIIQKIATSKSLIARGGVNEDLSIQVVMD